MDASCPFILDLHDSRALQLDFVGGKGANLARLTQWHYQVPQAFILTTKLYQEIFDHPTIKDALKRLDHLDVHHLPQLETISAEIRTTISRTILPDSIKTSILHSYHQLCSKGEHVAVRSSATAEDLAENSFAGQQDTYLHVNEENLIEKILDCWASLFTARAISYRTQSNIDHHSVKLAVIVQQMIPSEASGVAFTANPITGFRSDVVIDSTYGLGEALVSGLVTPDHYEIDFSQHEQGEIRLKTIGEKKMRIQGKIDGGTEQFLTDEDQRQCEALTEDAVLQLARLAKDVEKSYNGQAQDLEWAYHHGQFYLLQARPITTLFPLPKFSSPPSELRCLISFGTIQGFFEPITPLGQSALRTLLSQVLRKVGLNRQTSVDDMSADGTRHSIFRSAGHRLWIDITGILTSAIGHRFNIAMIDTGMNRIVRHLHRTKNFPQKSIFSFLQTLITLAFFVIPLIFKSIRNFLFPRYGANLYRQKMHQFQHWVDQGFAEQRTFLGTVRHFHQICLTLPNVIGNYAVPCILPAILSLRFLQKLARDPVDALALTRAVESNPTTEMNLNLWKLAELVRRQPTLLSLFQEKSSQALVDLYRTRSLDETFTAALEEFLAQYGCRGIGEIDFGRRRWSDEPERIFEQIQNYLLIRDPTKAIDKIHQLSQQSAYATLARIEQQLPHPWLQRPLLHFLFHRLRILFSLRESPKFHGLIQTFGKCRQALLQQATQAVDEGFLLQPDDLCYLYMGELDALAVDVAEKQLLKKSFWTNLIAQRRAEFIRQMSWKRVPLVLLSDGRTFYDATTIPEEDQQTITLLEGEYLGSPVSPGVYTGKVRIVDDPIHSELQPGEILVCTATDPAWTSLFPIVGALVLEMGGMLQHGAIVSREYGLPAVVGVANAKQIFHNGQRIEVNGSTGRIRVLQDENDETTIA